MKREGLEGAKKFLDFIEKNNLKLSQLFQTDASEPVTRAKVGKVLEGLRIVSEHQVQWLVQGLCEGSGDLINSKQLEVNIMKLKVVSNRTSETQRALVRLRKFIQETLQISLIDCFNRMAYEETRVLGELTREEVKEGLTKLTIHFPVAEVNLILGALDFDADGRVRLENWIRVLCSAALVSEEKRGPAWKFATAPRPIILAATSSDPRYTTLATTSQTSFPRPFTAPHSQPSLKHAPDASACVSSTHWSESSSIRPVEDLNDVLFSSPGNKLVEAARFLTNSAELGNAKIVRKEMRSLGTHAYAGPGRHHEVMGEIEEGGVVTVLETNGVWAKVQCGVYEGWVPLCKLDEEVQRPLYSRHDFRMRATDTKHSNTLSQVYIRKEPAWGSRALKKINATEPAEVLGINANWVKVEMPEGQRGWVSKGEMRMEEGGVESDRGMEEELEAVNDRQMSFSGTMNLFQDYDRKNATRLSAPDLPPASVALLKQTISRKMSEISLEHDQLLRRKLSKVAFRKRLINNWLNLKVSRSFQ